MSKAKAVRPRMTARGFLSDSMATSQGAIRAIRATGWGYQSTGLGVSQTAIWSRGLRSARIHMVGDRLYTLWGMRREY